jgi:uncharacterized lipoprotein YajG
MNKVKLITPFLLALMTFACALTEDTIDIRYNGRANITVVDGADDVSVAVKGEDKRTVYKDRVGAKKNGYGMEMAAIKSKREVAEIFVKAMEMELENLGFKVVEGDGATKNMNIEVVRFYNDFKMGFFAGDAVADGLINVKVMSLSGDILFSKTFEGGAINENIQLATGDNAKEALESALTDIMAKTVQDVELHKALLKK